MIPSGQLDLGYTIFDDYYEKIKNSDEVIGIKAKEQKINTGNIRLGLAAMIEENYEKWLAKKKRFHKNIIYNNYSDYLIGLCLEYESTKCRELINEFYDNKGLSKNLHKKNRNNNKRWTQ